MLQASERLSPGRCGMEHMKMSPGLVEEPMWESSMQSKSSGWVFHTAGGTQAGMRRGDGLLSCSKGLCLAA